MAIGQTQIPIYPKIWQKSRWRKKAPSVFLISVPMKLQNRCILQQILQDTMIPDSYINAFPLIWRPTSSPRWCMTNIHKSNAQFEGLTVVLFLFTWHHRLYNLCKILCMFFMSMKKRKGEIWNYVSLNLLY